MSCQLGALMENRNDVIALSESEEEKHYDSNSHHDDSDSGTGVRAAHCPSRMPALSAVATQYCGVGLLNRRGGLRRQPARRTTTAMETVRASLVARGTL